MAVGGQGANAEIAVTLRAEGESEVERAILAAVKATQALRRANQENASQARANARATRDQEGQTRRLDRTQRRATRSASDLGRSFRNILLRTVAIIGVLRTLSLSARLFTGLIRTGLKYNETLQTSELAIASLITATSDLVTANGEVLEGVEKLDAAYGLAEDQVQKLRIAGIQTAATTQDLVNAFQQAVGAGIQTGLTLDQIRNFTISLTQAAGALGVPYQQLNEEIRSILGGIIDQNTRIAKSLQITNDQIRAAKEQGRLYEFLNERFEAFNVAGERLTLTFAALKSNIQESLELLAGRITSPLFDTLTERGQGTLEELFNLETAQIADELQPLINGLQAFFDELGDLAADVFDIFVDGLKLSTGEGEEFTALLGRIGTNISRIVKATIEWVSRFVAAIKPLQLIDKTLEIIADVTEAIANNWALFAATATALLGGAALIFANIFGGMALAIAAGVTALAAFVSKQDEAKQNAQELLRLETRLARERGREREQEFADFRSIDRITDRYRQLAVEIAAATEGTGDYTRLLNEEKEIEEQLIGLGLSDILKEANGERGRAIALLENYLKLQVAQLQNEQELKEAELQKERFARAESIRQARIRVAQAAGNRREALRIANDFRQLSLIANEPRSTFPEGVDLSPEDLAREEKLQELQEQLDDLNRKIEQAEKLLETTAVSLVGAGNAAEDAADKVKKLRDAYAELDAALREAYFNKENEKLRQAFQNNEISITQFFRRQAELRQQQYVEEREALQSVIRTSDDEVEIIKTKAALVKLAGQNAIATLQAEQEEREALLQLEEKANQIRVQVLEEAGRLEEASRLKSQSQYDQLREYFEQNQPDLVPLIDRLIDLDVGRARFDELIAGAERLNDTLGDTRELIDLNVELGALTEREGRQQLAAEYQKVVDEIRRTEAELRRLQATSDDPTLVNNATEWLNLMEKLTGQIELLTNEWLEFEKGVRDAAQDSLAKYLSDAVIEAENLDQVLTKLGDLKSLLADLIAQIIQLTSRLIALKIIESIPIFSAGGGSVGGGSTAATVANVVTLGISAKDGGLIPRFDSGGKVRGPGGPTADKVPAMLSAGEYVIRAASVKKYGADLFGQLNAGLLPRRVRGYAEGGLVATGAQTGNLTKDSPGSLEGKLTVGLSEGLVVRDMDSPAGRRLIMKVISENRRGVRQSLGG